MKRVAVWTLFALTLASPVLADPPIWANAKWVKATYTDCGNLHYLTLKGNSAKLPPQPKAAGCTSSEEIYHQLNVAKTFFATDGKGQVAAWRADAGFYDCGKGEAMMNLGTPGDTERAHRQWGEIPGCKYSKRKFEYVTSMGSIPFTDVANGGTMSVAESLAMHAKERQQIIADCDANPACRAEVARMRAASGSGAPANPCTPGRGYSTYNGAGRCVDSNGNPDYSTFVTPH
jgi:hypothetical protein